MFYTYEWTEEGQWIADLDFEVEHEVTPENEVVITGLYLDKLDALQSKSPHLQAIASRAKQEILADEDWCAHARNVGAAA